MNDAIRAARASEAARLTDIAMRSKAHQSDPHAEPFYISQGAVRIGESPSCSIAGRTLPLLRMALAPQHHQGIEP